MSTLRKLLLLGAILMTGCGGVPVLDEGYPRDWSRLLEADNCDALVGMYENFAIGARRGYPAFLTDILFPEQVEATHMSIERSEDGSYHLHALNGTLVIASERLEQDDLVEGGRCENGYLEFALPPRHAFAGKYTSRMRLASAEDGSLIVRSTQDAAGFGYFFIPMLGHRVRSVKATRSTDSACNMTCQICNYPEMEKYYRGSCFDTEEARASRSKRTRVNPTVLRLGM